MAQSQDRRELILGYVFGIAIHVILIAIGLYVFSLLTTRTEFLMVSILGLLWAATRRDRVMSAHNTSMLLTTMLAGFARLHMALGSDAMNDKEALQDLDEDLSEKLKQLKIEANISRVTLGILEVICLYELITHVGSS